VAYQIPETPQQGPRLIAAYDATRRSLLERGIALRAAPDLTGFRSYLAARQRSEEMAAAEAALSQGIKGKRRRLGRETDQEVVDPQLRPVSWAVALRGDRRELEDAYAHRGQEAHAFVLNVPSNSPAVCGFTPPMRRAPDGERVARLAPASLEINTQCRRCLVLLYRAILVGEAESGPWPRADAVESSMAEATAAVAADQRALEVEQPSHEVEKPSHEVEQPAYEVEQPAYEEPAADAYAESAADAYAEPEPELEAVAESAADADAEPEPELEAVAESAADAYAEPEPELEAVAESAADAYAEPVTIPIVEEWDAEHDELVAAASEVEIEMEELAHAVIPIVTDAADPLQALLDQGVQDVLVVVAAGQTAIIVGGVGRGADWAGTVLDTDHEPILQRVWGSMLPLHREGPEAQRICGPFWARAAAVVPVGEAACVIFGSDVPLEVAQQLLVDAAHEAAQRFQRPSPEDTLADEREVAIALRRMMAGSELSFEGALEHVLTTTASILGCSIAAGVARMGRQLAMRAIDLDGADHLDPAQLLGGGPLLGGEQSISVEESLPAGQHLPAVVSRLRLPLNGSNVQGLLVMSHTAHRPRGFTTQDHRLAEAIAPAAVLVLERAVFGEGLRGLEDHLRTAPSTDPLTGLANQAAWEAALTHEADRLARSGGSAAVAAFRISGLRRIDEREGPLARDAALREAAELLRGISRSTDLAARVGEDEFRVLVRDGGTQGARRLATRIRRAARNKQASDSPLPPLTVSYANARSRTQLLAASRLVGQRLSQRSGKEPPRIGSGRSH